MRQIIDRITCDDCGRVFEFESIRTGASSPILMRLESTTEWLKRLGWICRQFENSSFQFEDKCPDCVRNKV